MTTLSSLTSAESKLCNISDRFAQSDAAKELFEKWYDAARTYAKSADDADDDSASKRERMMRTTLTAFETFLMRPDWTQSDSFAVSAMSDQIVKLIHILKTKRKFTALLFEGSRPTRLLTWLLESNAVKLCTRLMSSSHVAEESRVSVAGVLNELVWLHNALERINEDAVPKIGAERIVEISKIAAQSSDRLQIECLRALRSIALGAISIKDDVDPESRHDATLVGASAASSRRHELVRSTLANTATDAAMFRSLWAIGALRSSQEVEVVSRRALSSPHVAQAVMESLRTALLDMQSGGYEQDDRRINIVASVMDALHTLTVACDTSMGRIHDRAGSKEECVRSAAVLRFVEAVLDVLARRERRDDEALTTRGSRVDRFVDMLLSRPRGRNKSDDEDDTTDLDSLKLLTRMAPTFSETLYVTRLLPYVRSVLLDNNDDGDENTHLVKRDSWKGPSASTQQTSSVISRFSEKEQEVVNLLRECVRCAYSSPRRSVPSLEFGHMCFDVMLCAMIKGYGETERFASLIESVVASHYGQPRSENERDVVLEWIENAIRGRGGAVDDDAASTNAILSMCRELVFSQSLREQPRTTEFTRSILCCIARVRDRLSNAFWIDVLTRRPDTLHDEPEAMDELLRELIEEKVRARFQDDEKTYLQSGAKLLDALASSSLLSARIAPKLLRAMLTHTDRVVAFGQRTQQRYGQATFGINKESVRRALRYVTRDVVENDESVMSVVQHFRRHPSSEVRQEIARLLPHVMMSDASVVVRIAALKSFSSRRELRVTEETAREIVLRCCSSGDDVEESVADGLNVHDLDLLSEASPVLARLVRPYPFMIGAVTERLCRAARATAENDPQGVPKQVVLDALANVVRDCEKSHLNDFVREAYGGVLLTSAQQVSPAWRAYVKTCGDDGIVRRIVDGASNRLRDATTLSRGQWIRRLMSRSLSSSETRRDHKTHDDSLVAHVVTPLSVCLVDSQNQKTDEDIPVAQTVSKVADEDVEETNDVLDVEMRRWSSTSERNESAPVTTTKESVHDTLTVAPVRFVSATDDEVTVEDLDRRLKQLKARKTTVKIERNRNSTVNARPAKTGKARVPIPM